MKQYIWVRLYRSTSAIMSGLVEARSEKEATKLIKKYFDGGRSLREIKIHINPVAGYPVINGKKG